MRHLLEKESRISQLNNIAACQVSPSWEKLPLDRTPLSPHRIRCTLIMHLASLALKPLRFLSLKTNALHFPLFVTLHRCRGACSERPFETRCEARETESLTLLASKVTWSSGSRNSNELEPDVAFLPVTNHTKCGCPCAVKPAECDNRTQVYSKENCRCECKLIQPSCPIRFQWNPEKCQCVCHPSENQKICSKRLQFDDKRCKCVCSSRRCKMKTKIRDPRDCRCKCPRFPKCPPGTVRDAQTCNCDWAPKKSRSEMSRGRRRL